MRWWAEAVAIGVLAVGATACAEPAAKNLTECGTLTWDAYGKGEMRSWCTGCHSSQVTGDDRHGAPAGVDFDTVEGVRAHRDRIVARATGDVPTMPPVGGGDAEDRHRLAAWLACGAP